MLGKQVVYANDTPNFIANRIGVALSFTAGNLAMGGGFSIEEVDLLTGSVLGWPRTGIFRLADMVGIDILAHVAKNFPDEAPGGPFLGVLEEMLKRGWLGDKAGQGFYKKVRSADGKEERLALDLTSFAYRPVQKPNLPMVEMAKSTESLAERLRILLKADPKTDRSAEFLWPLLASLWQSAADSIGVAAADAPTIDAAMCAGFNWELGPFEMWDAADASNSVERMRAWGLPVSKAMDLLLKIKEHSWYSKDAPVCFNPTTEQFEQ